MPSFDFDYFCSANVVVYVGDQPLLDAAGISYDVQESRRPIYGYSSRLFDAVSRGNVLVSGSLLVNYINQDYLYDVINRAIGSEQIRTGPGPAQAAEEIKPGTEILDDIAQLGSGSKQTIENYTRDYWGISPDGTFEETPSQIKDTYNPLDMKGGVNIKVVFGEQGGHRQNGSSAYLLEGVHFTGRGQQIFVDQEVIVEQYSFIARNVRTLQNPYDVTPTTE